MDKKESREVYHSKMDQLDKNMNPIHRTQLANNYWRDHLRRIK